MGYNKRVLSKAVSELGKAKAPAKPKDIITDPAGQWKYPGQETRIPGNDITMKGVPYPVWAQPNVGPGSMMQPNQDYNFPNASYVDETPMVKNGGEADYEELELTDEEIQAYRDGGYVVEEAPEYETGGYVQHELVKAQVGLETEPQIAEEDKYATTVMDEVVVKGEKADWAKLQEQYEKNTPYEDYFHKRKEKYLKSRPKNLTKLMGIGNDDVPESVANSIYNDYQYRKNNYVTKNLGPKKGFNPRKHGEWVDNLSNKEREIISNSRYGKNLQPSLWARTGAGAQELANFLVKSTGIPALMGDPDKEVLNYKNKGLTNKEYKEIHNSGTGALETFSGLDVFGAAIANKLKNSKREQPGLFSGQLMGNVSPGDAAGLNPFLYTGIGEMMAGKSLLGLGADALRPGLNSVGKALGTESGLLSKVDKTIYPTRTYRAHVPGGNETSYEASELAKKINNKGDWTTKDLVEAQHYLKGTEAFGGKQGLLAGDDMLFTEYKVPFWKKNITYDKDVVALKKLQNTDINPNEFIIPNNKFLYPRRTNLIKAVPEEVKTFEELLPNGNMVKLYEPNNFPLGPNSYAHASKPYKYIEDQINAVTGHNMPLSYKFDGITGINGVYAPLVNWKQPRFAPNKGIGKFNAKELSGSTSLAPVRSGLGGMDMTKYEIKNPDYYTQLLDTYDSKALSSTNKKFYKDLIGSIKNQNGLVTERQFNELQRLKSGNFNFGKKAYEQGGITEAWEDELDDNQIERLRRAGYTVDELDEVEDVDTYQTGGPTVSQLWKEHTGTDWSEAHRQGLTSGSYADNMKLRDRILNSEFDNMTPGNNIQQNRVKSQNHRDAYVKNVQNLINNNKSLDDLVSMRMGTREGLLNLFPNLGSAKAPVNKPVANTVLPVNNKPVSKPAVKIDRRMAATSSPNNKLPQLKVFDKQVKTVKPKVKEIRSVNINKSATSSPESFNLDKYRTLTDIQQRFADAKKYNVANKIKQKEKVIKKEDKSVQWQMPQLGINAPTPKAKYPTNINNAASNFNTKNKNQKVLPGKKLKEVDRGIMATYIDPMLKVASPMLKVASAPMNSALNTLYDVGESIVEKTESTLGKVGELYESYKKEGLINALTQAKNSQKDPEVYKTVIKPKAKIVKPIPQAKEEAFDNDRLAENYQNITDAGNYTINTFSKKLSGVPLGVRNREDERDIKGKAIAYTYAPFKTYNEHLGNSYGGISLKPNSLETDNQPVIVYDNDKMYIDTFKNQKNTGKLISPTYKTDSVTDLVIDKSNRYSSNIEQKMIKLKTARGDKDIPVGTADSSEDSFKDWSGGHLMLENPKTKEVVVIHGKSYELQKMFRKFLQENKLKSANIIETDHKSYSLIKNPKNNILTGEFNRARDNANTKSSGSGNFIYSKI
jgi:hypothetical protein